MSNLKDRKVKQVTVTPELADRWLKKNTHNRPLREAVVDSYALAMKRGEWLLTPEAIAFSKPFTDPVTLEQKPETLMDGQHRLLAVIKSGCNVDFTVWFNCEPEEFGVIGQSCIRTASDILSYTRKDLKNPQTAASVVGAFVRFGLGQPTNLQAWVCDRVLEHIEPEVIEVVKAKNSLAKMAPRPVTAALLLAQMVNPSQTGVLVEQLRTAVGFTERDPARAIHQYIHSQLLAPTKDTPDRMFYRVCNAVKAKLNGNPLQVLRLNADGLAWLRDGAREKHEKILKSLYGRVPIEFWTPRLLRLEEERET